MTKATPAISWPTPADDHLRHRVGRCSTQCLGDGTWKIRLLSRAGRGVPSGNSYALGNLHSHRQRELHRGAGHRVAHCGQGSVLPSSGQHPIRLRTARSSAPHNFVPWRQFREHLNTTLASERCLRLESINSLWFSPRQILWLLSIAELPFTHCDQGNSCYHVADTGSDCPRRRPQRHPAQCHSNSAGNIYLYTCSGRDTRAGSA